MCLSVGLISVTLDALVPIWLYRDCRIAGISILTVLTILVFFIKKEMRKTDTFLVVFTKTTSALQLKCKERCWNAENSKSIFKDRKQCVYKRPHTGELVELVEPCSESLENIFCSEGWVITPAYNSEGIRSITIRCNKTLDGAVPSWGRGAQVARRSDSIQSFNIISYILIFFLSL